MVDIDQHEGKPAEAEELDQPTEETKTDAEKRLKEEAEKAKN